MLRRLKKTLLILLSFICLQARAQIGDTIKKDLLTAPDTVKHLHSKPLALIGPSALVLYGGLSFVIQPIRQLDYNINTSILRNDPNFNTNAESYFQFAPIILVYGLNMVGIEGKNRFIDRTALIGLSGAILGITTEIIKHSAHRLRPNGSDYLSFPSGHTTTAFAGAEFMAQEYDAKSPLYGVAAYAIATTTGVFRLYNHDHWFSDVVAGAGFGILSTKVAYLIYPYIRNQITHGDKKAKDTVIMPTYNDGVLGMSFVKTL
jgi:membrane-associated phospholipid phosphatase